MFEMEGASLACQQVPNGAEGELFSKQPDVKLFFFMDIFEHVTMMCGTRKLEVVGLLFAAQGAFVCINPCLCREISCLLSRGRKLERTQFKVEFLF